MSFDPEKITFFAKTDARGKSVSFGIKARDRQRHMYVVGKTGMGKSTLLENMAAQDIQNGEGMAFIDPHGSAAETLLDYIPEHRVDDVIYFAPFDLPHPISFNVMEDVGPDKRHLVVSGLMSTFKKIWVDAWSARMEYILTNALLALIEYPDTTLLSVNRLFSDKAYRNKVVEYIKDPAVKAFWTEEFANYTDRFAAEALPAIQNKIGQFTGNPLIRNIIGQPHSSFDIRKIMDEKKILIMNLSKGLVGETNANLLGSMLTTRIYLAAMSRADLSIEKMRTMPNFYFYVDEFQSFANSTFSNILSEARKYHLNLIIAHQYIEQMEEDVRSAVFGNVGTTITFRVGPFDAEVLETVFTPRFTAADLVNLGFAQIYLTLMIDGIGSQPFSAVTLPPVDKPEISYKEMAIAASRKNYTKDREEVEKLVTDLHTPVKPDVPNKKTAGNRNNNKTDGPARFNTGPNSATRNNVEKKPVSDREKTREPVSNYKVFRSDNQNNDKQTKSSFTKREPRPSFKEKTYENASVQKHSLGELREVLGQISNNGNNKATEDKSNNKINNNERNFSKERRVNKDRRETQSERTNHTSDLQNALSSLLGDGNNYSSNKPTGNDKNNLPPNYETSFKATKNNVVDGDESENSVSSEVKKREELEKLSAEVENTFNSIDYDGKESVAGQSVPVTDKETIVADTQEEPDTDIPPKNDDASNIFAPKSVQEKSYKTEPDPLTPDNIKKQLRQTPDERSPFAS